jgi:DNA transformation protein
MAVIPVRVVARLTITAMHRSPNALPPGSPSEDLTSLRDIGEVSARWLQAVGIHTVGELRRVGPAEAFGRVKFRFGRAANRNLLYALAMGLEGRAYNDATPAEKRRLCAQAGIPYHARRAR